MTDIAKRAAEFIRDNDPFGDHFSEHDLRMLAGEPVGPPLESIPVCAPTEKQASDAPVWYSAEEAAAWANGYNAAIDCHDLIEVVVP